MKDHWPPRLQRELALQEVDRRLSQEPPDVELRFARARLLTELGQNEEAKQAYLDLLAQATGHSGALNNLGALLHAAGFKTAARSCYAEAARRHPDNPMGHVNLANVLLEHQEWAPARAHYETALRLAPDHADAHQGMARLLQELGDDDAADRHRQMGFQNRAVTVLPYHGSGQPVRVVLLVSAEGGNIPIRPLLDPRTFLVTVVVVEFHDPAVALPPHHLVINSIGDADLSQTALEAAVRLVASTQAPVLNSPSAVLPTRRVPNSHRLRHVLGVVTPAMTPMPRAALAAPGALDRLSAQGFALPFLLRTPGFHNGRHFVRIEQAADLTTALDVLPGQHLTVIQFLDARGADGKFRKYRVMFIDGKIYPLHAAVSCQWKIHYVTADMDDCPEHQAEDSRFLNNMPEVLGPDAMAALERIRRVLDLDYAGVDFGLNARGELLLFEANATMVVSPPASDERWDYRRGPVERVLSAVRDMIGAKAAHRKTWRRRRLRRRGVAPPRRLENPPLFSQA